MGNLKKWFRNLSITNLAHYYWLKIREESKDKNGKKLCYCGHTNKCDCGDPDKQTFKDSVKRGSLIIFDKKKWLEKSQPLNTINQKLYTMESDKKEINGILPVVLNVFLVSTENRLISFATKNKELSPEQTGYIESGYGKIESIEDGSTGFTKTVINI